MAGFVAPEAPIDQGNSFVAPEAPIAPSYATKTPTGFPEPQASDNPPAGAEVPVEQRLANNVQAVGSGMAIPAAIEAAPALARTLGKGVMGAIGSISDALPATRNSVATIGDVSDNMLLRSMGARSGQVSAAGGLDASRQAAQLGRNAGTADIFSTQRTRNEALEALIKKHGEEIGNLRNEAGTASPGLLDQVAADLEKKYNPVNKDVLSNQYGKVGRSLNLVKNNANGTDAIPAVTGELDPLQYPTLNGSRSVVTSPAQEGAYTNAGIAQGNTALNDAIMGVRQTQRPVGAMTDVANRVGAANDADIASKLGSDKALQYVDALKNETGAYHLKPLMKRGAERQAVGAGGGGSGGPLSMLNKEVGKVVYRAGSKGLNAVHNALSAPTDFSQVPANATKTLAAYLMNKKDEE